MNANDKISIYVIQEHLLQNIAKIKVSSFNQDSTIFHTFQVAAEDSIMRMLELCSSPT